MPSEQTSLDQSHSNERNGAIYTTVDWLDASFFCRRQHPERQRPGREPRAHQEDRRGHWDQGANIIKLFWRNLRHQQLLPFEMSSVLSKMRLFNDNLFRHGHHIYMKRKRRERVQDSGETERVCVCERRSMAEGGGSVGCKMGCWRKRDEWDQSRIKRIRLHKFQNNFNGLSPTVSAIFT